MMSPHGMSGQPPAGYHPDYPGYPAAPTGHYSPHQPPVSSAGGFRLHGASPGGPQEPRELRAGQSPRIESPARPPPAREEEKEEDQAAPEVLAAMKVDKIKQDADPEMGFVISFDDDAAPRKPKPRLGQRRPPTKAASSGGLLDQPSRPEIPLEIDPTLPPETMKPLKPVQSSTGVGLVIGDELVSPKSDALDEMERKKERILMLSLKRKQEQEAARIRKEEEALRRKEDEARKEEEKQRKKEEEKARKERIFEQYKLKKAIEEAEKNGTPIPAGAQAALAAQQAASKPAVRPRPKSTPSKPRPKSMMDGGVGSGPGTPSRSALRGSQSNLQHMSERPPPAPAAPPPAASAGASTLVRHRSLSRRRRSNIAVSAGRSQSLSRRRMQTPEQLMYPDKGREGGDSQWGSNSSLTAGPRSRRGSNASLYGGTSGGTPRGYSETDSGLGRDTPTRRGVSPGAYGGMTSPSGPGSLPPGLVSRRRNYGDDGASDTSSMASYDYNGPRLFKQASAKSNRSILLNAVEYCVFPGAVNREAKQRVLEEIARVEARHFLILFRDARCQFRALYCYEPETEEVFKLYGTGPKMATDKMFDKFFKYNSGGKSFTQIHTKHLSVTIDAFTIHDALWQGKRPSLPSKKDMTLVT
ncbi:Patronin [Amphibalanus amphitrite]|uniref:Patronin n=1 Tax=Amphibalanus amphitrite TaxID=1232801 RepID=A0A6A4WHY1_AMPAM|nr:Patronin [Amphibalanus amphitrite]